MFRRVAGRPDLARMDRAAQRRRTMSRCQRTIVSGVTGSGSPRRRAFGIIPSKAASWGRKIRVSAIFHASSRRDSRNHVITRVIGRKPNRRHIIGDHHGRAARTATLLLTALDGILRTRRTADRLAAELSEGHERHERVGSLDADRCSWRASRLICSASSLASSSLLAATTKNLHRRTTAQPSLRSLVASATASWCDGNSTLASHWAIPVARVSAVSSSSSRWCSAWR